MKKEVVFADTNLFLRFLTNDVPDQAEFVRKLLHQAAEGKITLITTSIVIAEIVWTLESFYNEPKENIQQMVLSFLNTPGLIVDEGDLIVKALRHYVDKNIDYIDAYNAAWMDDHEISTIYTFDQNHFSRLENLTVITPGD
jgi:predicted nucleic-acid-binding protein